MTEIRLATADDLPVVARLFGKAFADDAMVRWPFPADAGSEDLTTLFSILLDVYWPLDAIWVIGDVSGAAVWVPPAHAQRFSEIEAPTRDLIRPLTEDNGARYDVFWDWLGGLVPDEPCWFLDILAVASGARGRGLAGRLIAHGLAKARAEGVPCFLETSVASNVGLYERFGFQVVKHLAAPMGGPTIWFMRADPPR